VTAPLNLQAYGWAQLDDGDWEFRDPSIPELVYLQSRQCWTTRAGAPIPHSRGGLKVAGRPDFVIGADGQVTAERGMYTHRPAAPYVVSQGRLTVQALYGNARSPRMYEPAFHAANPHLAYLNLDSPIPAGVRVHVPPHWVGNLQQAGYAVHRPATRQVLGQSGGGHRALGALGSGGTLGDAASIQTTLATLQTINGADVVADSVSLLTGGAGYALHGDTFDTYVASQKAGGQLAVDHLNPDVDITYGPIAAPFTQQAWALNGQLAAVPGSGSTNHDAATAKNLLAAIIQQYLNASNAVVAATPLPAAPAAPGAPAPAPTPAAPGAPTPRAAQTAAGIVRPSPAPAAAPGGGTTTPPATPPPDKAAAGSSTPWVIGGVIGAAVLLGVGAAVLKKKAAAGARA
jgi:hypothetical protein